VLAGHGPLSRSLHLVRTAREVPTMVVTAGGPWEDLQALGVQVLSLPGEKGRPDVGRLLDELGRRRMTNVLVEGGSRVLGSFYDARAIDEVHVFIAPRLLGDGEALTPIAGIGAATIADGLALVPGEFEMLEGDIVFHGWKAEPGA
jgi:diaminohydroxyphosphoribosylaminopyrimidine deaminase/5-amino-6-(5-phosphoribosylamino)uracil reductase